MTAQHVTDSVARAMPKRADEGVDQTSESQAMSQGITVLSYLIAGVAFYGGLGWLGDRYFHTAFLLPLGIVLGAAGGIYLTIRRFGNLAEPPARTSAPADETTMSAAADEEEDRWDR